MKPRKGKQVKNTSAKTELRARMVDLQTELPNDMATATATHARLIAGYKAALDIIVEAQAADTLKAMKAAVQRVARLRSGWTSGEYDVPF